VIFFCVVLVVLLQLALWLPLLVRFPLPFLLLVLCAVAIVAAALALASSLTIFVSSVGGSITGLSVYVLDGEIVASVAAEGLFNDGVKHDRG
jgi:hypothetical protein